MEILPLTMLGQTHHQRAAELLVSGFAAHWPNAWPNLDSAMAEVRDLLQPENIVLAAVGHQSNELLGWVGGLPEYDGHVLELHPLVVAQEHRGHGVGRALVAALEAEARCAGYKVIMLGTDDEDNMTSLGGVRLLPDVWGHIANIQNYKRHPYSFYQELGYVITGVVPDANGEGKPDILMAKSLLTEA